MCDRRNVVKFKEDLISKDFCTASLMDLRPAIRSTSNRNMGPENTGDCCLNTIIFAINTFHQHDM